MAKINCPLCGKPNPEEHDVCQFCEAPLNPNGDDTSSLSPSSRPSPMDTNELEQTLPPWLQNARGTSSSEETSPEISDEEDGDPEWLQRIRALEAEEEIPAESTPEKSESPEADIPDWLQELGLGEEEKEKEPALSFEKDLEESPPDEDEESDPKADLPDWVLEMRSGAGDGDESGMPDLVGEVETVEPSPAGTELEESPFGEEDVPDWFDDEEGEDAQEADLPEWLLAEDGDESGVPDLVGEVETVEPSPTGAELEESPFGEEDVSDWFDDEEEEEVDLSDWFSSAEEAEDVEEASEEDLPGWLLEEDLTDEEVEEDDDYTSPFIEEGGEAVDEDIFADDLPRWLVEASSEELAEEGLSSEDLDEITPGELPGWVEAMRPVKTPSQEDAELTDEGDAYVEHSGLLAGIANILPVEAGVVRTPQAPKRSFKLNVSESQQEYVSLLEDLIASERENKMVLTQPLLSTQRVLRWLIALVLFLSIGLTFFSPMAWFSYPFQREETQSVYAAIQALPEPSSVLVAFDYEPALSGEMNAIAAGVVDHLMLKGAYLTFVSTSPTGPVLVENFLKDTQAEHNYTHGLQYVNLGYIPGEAAGLLSFVIAPQNIMPLAFDGADAWEMQPLQDVVTVADFSMVLVITDDSDTARMWIEQVQPGLEGTPLMMAVSAQAEPLVRPYYEAIPRQVTGLVSGLPGGASYEQLTGRGSLAHEYWSAYNVGIMVTVAVLLVSGIVNVFLNRLDRKRSHAGEDR